MITPRLHSVSLFDLQYGVSKCPFTVRALSAVRAPDTSARLIRSPSTQRASEDLQRIQSLGAASLSYSNPLARDVQSIAYEARAAGQDPGGCGGGGAHARHRAQDAPRTAPATAPFVVLLFGCPIVGWLATGQVISRERLRIAEVSRGRAAFGGDPHRIGMGTSSAAGITGRS